MGLDLFYFQIYNIMVCSIHFFRLPWIGSIFCAAAALIWIPVTTKHLYLVSIRYVLHTSRPSTLHTVTFRIFQSRWISTFKSCLQVFLDSFSYLGAQNKNTFWIFLINFWGPVLFVLTGHSTRPFNLHLDFWKSRSWEIKVCFKP